ncbi:universal stress protein [Haloglomus litoreum]|uniref:universal stress protein n=1 Tax=Haloglomus litoreum TaxID=3034026 RepID=UPI0023E86FB3|nr:universal stress protein [Haloglomus sp. DT116]
MYDTVLIATDGSDRTRPAVTHGLALAARYGATVHALYVVDTRAVSFDEDGFTDYEAIIGMLTDRGERATAVVAEQARDLGLETETAVVQGTPARGIRRYADEHDADLIAMGTRGRGGLARRMLGSVAASVLEKATQPVLTTRSAVAEREADYDRILLPTDGGRQAERVAEHTFDIAARYDATVHALSVIDSRLVTSPGLLGALEQRSEAALDAVTDHGERVGVDVKTSVWRGTPSDCITTYAADRDIDLLTMGAHGKRRLDRFLTANVAERVVRTASCPTLTLRRQDD